ncbi:hypothetical protein JYU34_022417 [Plutella xylostella]|uniref:Secreted protein n=1 Tax=Plutella xylostella TaxID=51655 RepID=A0ABQ7PR53_PLUXY|nr:hypothetical protein JYU34_022417 [Plutella xylostella]
MIFLYSAVLFSLYIPKFVLGRPSPGSAPVTTYEYLMNFHYVPDTGVKKSEEIKNEIEDQEIVPLEDTTIQPPFSNEENQLAEDDDYEYNHTSQMQKQKAKTSEYRRPTTQKEPRYQIDDY